MIISNLSSHLKIYLTFQVIMRSNIPSMPSISISTGGIETLLNKLDTNKSAGPNQIPSHILKHRAHEVAPIL